MGAWTAVMEQHAHDPVWTMGGMTLRVLTDGSARFGPNPYTRYSAFEPPPGMPAPDGAVLAFRLDATRVPETRGLAQLYRNRKGLTWYREPGGFLVRWVAGPEPGALEWFARFDSEFTSVTLHTPTRLSCGQGPRDLFPHPAGSPLVQVVLSYYLLRRRQGLLHHTAAVLAGDRALMLTGRSGAGKSTMAGLAVASGLFTGIADDRVFSRPTDGGFQVYGTPWPSSGGLAENLAGPLAGIFFLSQARTCRIETVSCREAFEQLLPVADLPWWDEETLPAALDYLDGMSRTVPAFRLHFTPTQEAATCLCEFVAHGGLRGRTS